MPAKFWRALPGAVLVGMLSIPATAGLFGSIGKTLGIGGDAGKVLDFADGFLPGGGGPTDAILGAPANAAFGGAISKWAEANDKSIAKLGETNDRTVAKLLQGLQGLQAEITSNLETLDASLTNSISSLDESLEKNIEKLDSSLTDQTQRLDTVFQKQVSTFFFFGRVLLTVIVLGGFVYAANRAILAAPDVRSFRDFVVKRRWVAGLAAGITVVAVLATWLTPDPGQLRQLEERYVRTYERSMKFGDFANAQNHASQLTVLRPESAQYRAWNLKAAAFRDLVLRPTVMTSDDRVHNLYVRLGQVNEYRKEEAAGEDVDVLMVYGLVDGIRARRELDYVGTTVAFAKALERSSSPDLGKGATVEHLAQIARRASVQLRRLSLPPEMLEFAIGKAADSAVDGADVFLVTYAKIIASPILQSVAGTVSLAPDAFGQLDETLSQRLEVRAFYRGLTARYFAYLDALARSQSPGASAQTVYTATSKYCALQTYYKDWHAANYTRYGNSLTFLAQFFAGPFTVLSRAHALNKTPNACEGLSDASIKAQVDLGVQWLGAGALQRAGKGAVFLKSAVAFSAARQADAFAEYEKAFALLKDIQDPNIASIADQTSRATKAETVARLAELSAVLGIFAPVDDKLVPAVHALRIAYVTGGTIPEARWRQATRAFLENRFGA